MLTRALASEALGSLLLTATVIGSGILASGLADGNDAVALLGNTAATAAILFVLVFALGPVSGAHFNPAVTLAMLCDRRISLSRALAYIPVQLAGCVLGAMLAHAMFDLPVLQAATADRSGGGRLLSEGAATFALVFAIFGALRWRPEAAPGIVALTITAGYWWTASTSFANPAITVARSLSDTFAGIRPADAPGFIAAQVAGALAAWACSRALFPKTEVQPA